MSYIWIAVGAGLGGMLRYWVSGMVARFGPDTFPLGTMLINISGSMFIGFFAALTGPQGRLLVAPNARLFVMTGICGGYTTFSSFSLETLRLMQDRQWGLATANVLGSVALCLLGVWLGNQLAAVMNQR
ncbi:MAG: fluoride efflux transporter CrcB [Paludibaculum sp.]